MTGEQKPGGLEVVASWDDLKALLDRAEARATAAEAKLARAVEGLEIAHRALLGRKPFGVPNGEEACEALAEIRAALQQGTQDQ